jgi:hypothetical protein
MLTRHLHERTKNDNHATKEGSPSEEGLPWYSSYRLSFISELLGHAASSDNQDDNGDDQYGTNSDDSPE